MSAIDNKQLKAAQAEAATATDTYTHVFKKPFTYEDKTYEQLTLDFGSLTGRDFMAIDREVREREGRVPIVPVYDTSFLMRMVCRASKEKIDYDTIVAAPLQSSTRSAIRRAVFCCARRCNRPGLPVAA